MVTNYLSRPWGQKVKSSPFQGEISGALPGWANYLDITTKSQYKIFVSSYSWGIFQLESTRVCTCYRREFARGALCESAKVHSVGSYPMHRPLMTPFLMDSPFDSWQYHKVGFLINVGDLRTNKSRVITREVNGSKHLPLL